MKKHTRECHSSSLVSCSWRWAESGVGQPRACLARCAAHAPVAAASPIGSGGRDNVETIFCAFEQLASRRLSWSPAATSTDPKDKIGSVFDERHGDRRIVHDQPRQLGGAGLVEVQMAARPLHGSGPSRRKSAGSAVKEARSHDASRG